MSEDYVFDMRERMIVRVKCLRCGVEFKGRERQMYCVACGKVVQRERIRKHHEEKRAKKAAKEEQYGKV